jgi:hypothetical protein
VGRRVDPTRFADSRTGGNLGCSSCHASLAAHELGDEVTALTGRALILACLRGQDYNHGHDRCAAAV